MKATTERQGRQKMEAALSASQAKFDALVNANIIGIVQGNADIILEANDKFLSLVGYTREDLLMGRVRWRDMAAPEYVEQDRRAFDEMVTTGRCAPFEKAYVCKDGSRVHTLIGAAVTSREPLEWMSFVLDLTERKQFEEQIAALYQREHRIAESLQRALLNQPSSRLHPEIEVETVYRAAWEEAEVGGDYFDVFPLRDQKLALVVGDVSGKGLKAAARTAEIKHTLRAYLREYPQSETALILLNNFLCESQELDPDQEQFFVVMTVAILDPVTGSMDIAVGGAEPPLIVRASGSVEQLQIEGLPLGIVGDTGFGQRIVPLSPGDLLLIATDGITEARRDEKFLGIDGLASLARQASEQGSLKEIAQALLEGASTFARGALHDDVCLVLARLIG